MDVEKSPLQSPTFNKAKRRRKLATSPVFGSKLKNQSFVDLTTTTE